MAGAHGYAIGVDFGTSTSLVAEQVGRAPVEILPLGRTTRWFPSIAGLGGTRGDAASPNVTAFDTAAPGVAGARLLVGEDAEALSADQVLRSIKRAITDNQAEVVCIGPDGPCEVPADDAITALLAEIARRSTAAGVPISFEHEVRLGCPAIWDGDQRQRLLELATRAGLPVDESTLVDEPVAAGIAWVTDRFVSHGERPNGRLLVFDMGGGTLDVAVLDVVGGERPQIGVLSALGGTHAGDVLDTAIADDLTAEYAEHGFDVTDLPQPELVRAMMLRAARQAKVALSRRREHRVVLPRVIGQLPALPYSRARLEETLGPQLRLAEQLVWDALRAARLTQVGNGIAPDLRALGPDQLTEDVGYVLLVGGMSRVPYLKRWLGALFPGAQVYDSAGVGPEEAVVAGLAATTGYNRFNLHRPGLDFVIEWEEAGQHREHTVYRAYSPLYEPWQVTSGRSDLGYERHGRELSGPPGGDGVLRVRAPAGEPLGLVFEGQEMDGLRMTFGPDVYFKLYCDGRIAIRDGAGRNILMRSEGWPVIEDGDVARLVLTRAEEEATAVRVEV